MTSNESKIKKLFILRHAKSSWGFSHLTDFERPLAKRGLKDVPDMGNRLKAQGILPDLLLSSPAQRAIQTARGIAHQIGYDPQKIEENPKMYHAQASHLRKTVSETNNKVETLMIFGHNPGFTDLINDTSDFRLDNLPTCAVCGIEFEINSWKEILKVKGRKFYYDYPKSGLSTL